MKKPKQIKRMKKAAVKEIKELEKIRWPKIRVFYGITTAWFFIPCIGFFIAPRPDTYRLVFEIAYMRGLVAFNVFFFRGRK